MCPKELPDNRAILGAGWYLSLGILPSALLDALVHPGRDHYLEAEGVSWINSDRQCWKVLQSQWPLPTDGGSP